MPGIDPKVSGSSCYGKPVETCERFFKSAASGLHKLLRPFVTPFVNSPSICGNRVAGLETSRRVYSSRTRIVSWPVAVIELKRAYDEGVEIIKGHKQFSSDFFCRFGNKAFHCASITAYSSHFFCCK